MKAVDNEVALWLALAGGLVACLGALTVFANLSIVYVRIRDARRGTGRFVSLVPLAGPLLVSLGLIPFQLFFGLTRWATALAWATDPATWITLMALVYVPWRSWRDRKE